MVTRSVAAHLLSHPAHQRPHRGRQPHSQEPQAPRPGVPQPRHLPIQDHVPHDHPDGGVNIPHHGELEEPIWLPRGPIDPGGREATRVFPRSPPTGPHVAQANEARSDAMEIVSPNHRARVDRIRYWIRSRSRKCPTRRSSPKTNDPNQPAHAKRRAAASVANAIPPSAGTASLRSRSVDSPGDIMTLPPAPTTFHPDAPCARWKRRCRENKSHQLGWGCTARSDLPASESTMSSWMCSGFD